MDYDVVVVGGGAAGLSGAVALARSLRSVLVVDAGEPRNAPAAGVHNYLGREGTPPAELYAAGRAEAEGYGVEFARARVTALAPGFRVTFSTGRVVTARKLLVTTGLTDELPDLPGLAERWGRDVLHCPFCHGYEVRGQAIGVLSTGSGMHQALLFSQLSSDVTLFLHTGDQPTDEEWEQLAARGIAVVDGEVTGLEVADDRLTGVRLASGRVVARDALVVAPRFTANSDLLAGLGLAPEPVEMMGRVVGHRVPANPMGATAVPGVYVAGNVADVSAQVVVSAAAGMRAGAALHGELMQEETRAAVERRRVFSAASERELSAALTGARAHGL
ncbi:NAD(P)/FAD-dependent oxidoreductase [Pseudonocardia kujensis]|uniref:NAD(P)/FAD-dependent oxidoreductase n=1 Tax=Pseudonocardia kujensis TaxID=1128675 RepID=UPI001E461C43|nr:NAD(P)/FAD-dependent oxidoreductase [Pseudonocardia kujensis]MCE0766043.1 NAD(P)/FAD-dependent oxidoreductase [Pseudonocardia kujensis]